MQVQLADKSLYAKECSRKSEERIHHLQKKLDEQVEANSALREICAQRSQSVVLLEKRTRDLRHEIEAKDRNSHEKSTFERERELANDAQSMFEAQLRKALEDKERQSEARDLLQDRYKALTNDMEQLRQETLKYKEWLTDAEKNINQQQQLLVESETLSEGTKKELDLVKTEFHELGRNLQDAKRELSIGREDWKAEKRDLELERDRFQERALDLQHMVDKVHASKGSSTSQEVKPREALISEEQRSKDEESALNSYIKVLQANISEKGDALEKIRSELVDTNERLRKSEQSREFSNDKIQGLQDEIEVLQCSLEECNESRRNLQATTHNIKNQRESEVGLEIRIAQLDRELASVQQDKSSLINQLTQAQSQLDTYSKNHNPERHSSISSELELRAEVIKLQRKIMETSETMSRLRTELKEREAACQRKVLVYEATSKKELAGYEQRQKKLELDLSVAHEQLREMTGKNNACNESCGRLRIQIQDLEDGTSRAQAAKLDNFTVAQERKDLHELLIKAKLEAEDLQTRLQAREADLQRTTFEGKSIRRRLDNAQADQANQKDQITALLSELETLQLRHEDSVESLGKKQKEWEEERKTLMSKVRLLNTSFSRMQAYENSLLRSIQVERREADERHAAEIRGLAKQIQWMRARCSREESFRAGLIFEKRFLLLQVDMFNAW